MNLHNTGPSVVSEVHNDFLGLTAIQCKVVVLTPSCQLGYLISVLNFIVVSYETDNCCSLQTWWSGCCSLWLNSHVWTVSTAVGCNALVLRTRVDEVLRAIITTWGLPVRYSIVQLQMMVPGPRSLSFRTILEGMMLLVLNAESCNQWTKVWCRCPSSLGVPGQCVLSRRWCHPQPCGSNDSGIMLFEKLLQALHGNGF